MSTREFDRLRECEPENSFVTKLETDMTEFPLEDAFLFNFRSLNIKIIYNKRERLRLFITTIFAPHKKEKIYNIQHAGCYFTKVN